MPTSPLSRRPSAAPPVTADTTEHSAPPREGIAAALLALQGLLLFVPLTVLGAAIGWPASLDDPASVALPRLLENEGAVRAGYLAYLLYSVLFLPVAVWTARALRVDLGSPVVQAALGFAVASVVARCVGIIRWLDAMPALAGAYDSAPDDATRTAVTVQYEALNAYGGSIGELLGVSLFAALWLVLLLSAARGLTPRWLVLAGFVAAGLLALPLVELAGYDAGPLVTVGTTALQLWFLAAAVVLLRRSRARS
jgi:hypothetical protein